MQGQGITFQGEGPQMEGTWYNPVTGDKFTVRDSCFMDNQYMVQTTDGRNLTYNQLQNYVKSDKPIPMDESKIQKNTINEIPDEVKNLIEPAGESNILPEDEALLGNLYNAPHNDASFEIKGSGDDDKNLYIINKALSKCTIPEIKFEPKWTKFPEREIRMLMELMEISKDEIVDWYLKQLNTNKLLADLTKTLKKFITDKMDSEAGPVKTTKVKKAKTTTK